MKVLKWVSENILFVITLFLLAFIPLYPKLPILNVQHTWVYVRLEDFLISAVVLIWFVLLVRKKATFKTPLTIFLGTVTSPHALKPRLSIKFNHAGFLSMSKLPASDKHVISVCFSM